MKKIYKIPLAIVICSICFYSGAIFNNPQILPFANHQTGKAVADSGAHSNVPFTQWNDINSHETTHFSCSGDQEVRVDDIETSDKIGDHTLSELNFYSFISVSQGGFVIAKNDTQTTNYDSEGLESKDYTGEYVSKTSAGSTDSKGNEVVFTFFTVQPDGSKDNKDMKYYLISDTLSSGAKSKRFTCNKIKDAGDKAAPVNWDKYADSPNSNVTPEDLKDYLVTPGK